MSLFTIVIEPDDIEHAVELLSQQFRNGQRNHRYESSGDRMGFMAAQTGAS